MKKFKETLVEAKHKSGEIQKKDWDRMMDLVLADKDGSGTAKSIKDKDKAIARYVAGTKILYGDDTPENIRWNEFSAFGEKALELGATEEEIESVLKSTIVPTKVLDKYKELKNKKLGNRFVGVVSKVILKMGFDIKYLPHNGDAITWEGRDAMSRNGRKWTIGYKTEITNGDVKISFVFDAITDEGDGPTYYVISEFIDSISRKDSGSSNVLGQRKFISWIESELGKYK